MIKKSKNELSKSVSRRIDEILRLTKLPIHEFAPIAGINIRSLKGYQSGGIPITLESILKICTVLSIDFHTFCDFNKKLSIQEQWSSIALAAEQKKTNSPSVKPPEVIDLKTQERREKNKKYRDQIIAIAEMTDYFLRPRTLYQMTVDFAKDYNLHTTAERLQGMLQRCVAKELIKKHPSPLDYSIGYHIPKRTLIYFKDEKVFLADVEKIFGYNWLSNSIVV